MDVWSEKLIWPLIKWSQFSGTITYLSIIFRLKRKKILAIILTAIKGQKIFSFHQLLQTVQWENEWPIQFTASYLLQAVTAASTRGIIILSRVCPWECQHMITPIVSEVFLGNCGTVFTFKKPCCSIVKIVYFKKYYKIILTIINSFFLMNTT